MQIRRETRVTEDRESLLQRELEPVPAGDAVARPVVEVLVADDAFDALQLGIRRGLRIRQHQLGVEDVETLVLHRAHVEVAHGDEVELLEVVLEAIAAFIPGHGALQGGHRVGREGRISGLDMNPQLNRPAAAGHELIAHLLQGARHQGEQVGGLREGVVPDGVVTAGLPGDHPRLQAVAVGEQHRAAGLIGFDAHPETTEQIRAVGMEGDPPKALGLALGGEEATADVEPLQAGVGLGLDLDPGAQAAGRLWWRQQHQLAGLQPIGLRGERLTVQLNREQLQLLPQELPGSRLGGGSRGNQLKRSVDHGVIGVQLEQQLGVLDRERGRAVVSEADGGHAGEQSPRNGTPPRRHAAAHLRAEQSTKGDRPCPSILAGERIGRRPSG